MSTFKIIEPESELRASDMLKFFRFSGRNSNCPYCNHVGQWDFHIQLDELNGQAEDDPLLVPFKIEMAGSKEGWTKCAGMTCPQCGHFELVSMYKIYAFKQAQGGASHG